VASSSYLGLSLAIDHAVRLRPKRVLDLGVGLGKWGLLLREALDFIEGRFDRASWQVVIDGIDAHRYDSPILDWVYDDLRIADVSEVVDELAGYDLVVMGDVIEHFEKDIGLAVLRALLAQNTNVILTTPFHYFDQEREDNPFQRHRSHWTLDDFSEWNFDYDVAGGMVLVVALAGRGASWPRRQDARASRVAYGVPFFAQRGAATRVLKQFVRRIP
jgi:hypothetical protein